MRITNVRARATCSRLTDSNDSAHSCAPDRSWMWWTQGSTPGLRTTHWSRGPPTSCRTPAPP
eukprot:9291411-Pyramimonas_sp.AAC.1